MEVITSSSSRLTIKLIHFMFIGIGNVNLTFVNNISILRIEIINSNDFRQVFHANEFPLNSLKNQFGFESILTEFQLRLCV